MSEPDIATLARRLAEQNNVDWRALSGSGPDGKIVERDVLDYLARVMAGDEALDPTPEPLPDGMEAWPDQDTPAYFKPNGAGQQAHAEQASDALEAADDLLADLPGEDLFDEAQAADDAFPAPAEQEEADIGAAPAFSFGADPSEVEAQQVTDDVVFAEPEAGGLVSAEDEELSDDIFLFDDEDEDDDGVEEVEFGSVSEGVSEGAFSYAEASVVDSDDDDTDDALLVADDDLGDDLGDDQGDDQDDELAAELGADLAPGFASDLADDAVDQLIGEGFTGDVFGGEPAEQPAEAVGFASEADSDAVDGASLEVAEDAEAAAGVFASSMESYDHDFTTPSEQFENDSDVGGWTGGDLSDLGAEHDGLDASGDEGSGTLPDLWASDGHASATESEPDEVLSAELSAELADEFDQPAVAAAEDGAAEFDFGEADAADDVEDLEQAEALDEHDATLDLQDLDGEPDTITPAAAFAGLPLVRTGNVMRRHVDLSALAGAQLAAGLELGHDEPLSAAPFLLRAVAKAVAELGQIQGQVALAELEDEVLYRRVDDAAGRAFGSLVEELAAPGSEEDELGLVAVDLSGFDMDEVLLDLSVPAVTLGRVLYDTQRGAHRSTLTLSGELPLTEGARLLARVADLLESPVRLLL